MITLNVVKYFNGPWRSILGNRLSGNIVCVNKTRPMSTIDSKAVEYHSAMKNIWWDENGPLNGLHSYNPLRIQFVKDGLINVGVKLQNSDLPLRGLIVQECVKIVKPDKSMFITTINKTLTSLLSTIVAAEYIFGSAPRGNHQWNKFIAPHEVQRILENYGCETKFIRGMHFNPATRRWSRPSTVSTFYGLHAIKHKETGM
ncbi:ubiquinone biosynthesis O-methyltransferase, mitochondrial-like [Temnothorax nylanderi]|uniref:ubiquinone biosynthesis O-methyltransferase, mitochondrial-like n=1 Tax=Temnothorax nylanderi TaxID=102681 RepID=UPI003A845FAD